VRPITGLTVGADLTYLDAKLDQTNNIPSLLASVLNDPNSATSNGSYTFYTAKNGNPIPYTSQWNIGANVNYAFPIEDHGAFVGGQVTYRSWTTSSIGDEAVFRIPGYTVIDLQTGMDFADGRYRVMLWGKNIFNTFYVTNVARYTDGIQRFVGMPATYGITLSATF